jgi:hypothetical protein
MLRGKFWWDMTASAFEKKYGDLVLTSLVEDEEDP